MHATPIVLVPYDDLNHKTASGVPKQHACGDPNTVLIVSILLHTIILCTSILK